MEKLGLNLGYLLVQILNFAIIFVVLRAWVYKPILRMLDKRREAVAKGLEDARIAAEARANAEGEAQKIISEAQAKASVVIREATDRAAQAVKELKSQAESEAAKAHEAAIAEATAERDKMLGEVRGQVSALAISAAHKLVGEALDEKRQRELLQEFFSGVKSGKVFVLEGQSLKAGPTMVTSALPLTDAEKSSIQKDLLDKAGASVEVVYDVDPTILGGLKIKVGDKLIDGSVAGQLDALKTHLQ